MLNLKNNMNYAQYFDKSTEEQKLKQEEAYRSTLLTSASIVKVQAIEKTVNVVVFSEGYCPDCTVAIPFILKMSETNDNIKLNFVTRNENKDLLEEWTGEARIPTIITFDENLKPKGVFIEFPEALKEKMTGKSLEEIKHTVSEYREGKYNDLIEAELLRLVL